MTHVIPFFVLQGRCNARMCREVPQTTKEALFKLFTTENTSFKSALSIFYIYSQTVCLCSMGKPCPEIVIAYGLWKP